MTEIKSEFQIFLKWVWRRFKKLKPESDKLYTLIKKNGFDTAKKQNALIPQIIEMFNLSEVLVFNPGK